MRKKNKYILILILIHIIVISGVLFTVILLGRDYSDLLLRDDCYYSISKDFVSGGSLLHRFRGPFLPVIYSFLFFFPESFRPFLRLVLSMIFSVGVLLILFQITKDYLTDKQFFFGSLIFILNPVYIHWIFRSTPEVYLSFFLGLFILCVINYFRTYKIYYLILASIVFILTFFIKPVFLFIPFALLVATIVIRSRRLVIYSSLLLIIGFWAYNIQERFTHVIYPNDTKKEERQFEYVHKIFLIEDSFWVDYVLKTKQFHKGTLYSYPIEHDPGQAVRHWISDFFQKYPESNYIFMNIYFIYDRPLLVLQKILISPLFYFSMSARTIETFIKLAFTIVSLSLSILGIKIVLKTPGHTKEVIIIMAIITGYILLHLLTHAMNRYSMPVLPYLYVWGGTTLLRFKETVISKATRPRVS